MNELHSLATLFGAPFQIGPLLSPELPSFSVSYIQHKVSKMLETLLGDFDPY